MRQIPAPLNARAHMETIALKTVRLMLLLVFASWVFAIVSALVLTARLTRKHGWRGCLWGALSILGAVLAGGFVSALIGLIEGMGHYAYYLDSQFYGLVGCGTLGVFFICCGWWQLRRPSP